MPGNWDYVQHLKNGKVEWPKGDTDVGAMQGFDPWRVEAWVVQSEGIPEGATGQKASWEGPSQTTSWERTVSKPGPSDRWATDTLGWMQGSFREGPAVGIAFVASKSATGPDRFKFNWWFDVIDLKSS
jgi:hypothetical protein